RALAPHEFPQPGGARVQLLTGELVGTGARERDEVGDADPGVSQERLGVVGPAVEHRYSRRDAGGDECGIEAVAGTAEVRSRRRGHETRVDPDDEKPERVGQE